MITEDRAAAIEGSKADSQREAAPEAVGHAALHGRLLNVSRMATVGEIAAGVAHELNQPLTAIANYAQACERLLSYPDIDRAEMREALRQITVQSVRAADIIRRLRTLADGLRGHYAPANINTLVIELQELLRTDALSHGVQLSLELCQQLPLVSVDGSQIQQIVLNFVRNSLEALTQRPTPGAEIVIRTALAPNHQVELSVSDNGPGLSSEAAERLFDPFFSTKEHGTGLGLAISHTIARSHGGSVGYRANHPTGACFFILLPIVQAG